MKQPTVPCGQQKIPEGSRRPVVLSLEMFERDVQHIVDEYAAGIIPLRDLLYVRSSLLHVRGVTGVTCRMRIALSGAHRSVLTSRVCDPVASPEALMW